MELSGQIKKYRAEAGLTQDELAEQVFVTRQTVSNWENDRSYPDVHSLLRLSALFRVSLDTLVKGDLTEMKEQIKREDIQRFNRDGWIFSVLLILSVVLAVPLFVYLEVVGVVLWAALWGVSMYFAFRVEKQKKSYDIQTYREIVAFTEGKQLDELQKAREEGKRPYQKVVSVLISAAFGAGIAFLMCRLLLR